MIQRKKFKFAWSLVRVHLNAACVVKCISETVRDMQILFIKLLVKPNFKEM